MKNVMIVVTLILLAVCTTLKAEEVSEANTEPQIVLVYINNTWIVVYQDSKDENENDIDKQLVKIKK